MHETTLHHPGSGDDGTLGAGAGIGAASGIADGPARALVTLPTMPIVIAAALPSIAAGLLIAGLLMALGRPSAATAALAGGAIVAAAGAIGVLVLRPWHPRPLMNWPVAWVAGSFLALALSVGGAALVYSAALGERLLWLAVVVAYVAGLSGKTRAYAAAMRRHAPGHAPAARPGQAAATPSVASPEHDPGTGTPAIDATPRSTDPSRSGARPVADPDARSLDDRSRP